MREIMDSLREMTQGDDSAQFERYVRRTMRRLAGQQVGLVLKPATSG